MENYSFCAVIMNKSKRTRESRAILSHKENFIFFFLGCVLAWKNKNIPYLRRRSLVKSQQWNQQKNVWNLVEVNN